MRKETTWLLGGITFIFVFMAAYPIYRSLSTVYSSSDSIAISSLHEYTVLDLETSKQMVMFGDDNIHEFVTNDTAWRDERYLYKDVNKASGDAMKVVIVATYNQLYE